MKKKDKQDLSLVGHLTELRKHLILSVILFTVVTLIAFYFSDVLVDDMVSKAKTTQFVYLSPAELFTSYMRIAVVAGLLVSLPFFLNRLWVFVKPGLYETEVKTIRIALLLGFILFIAGMVFAYMLVLPMSLDFFARFQTERVQSAVGFANYFDYVTKIVFSFALVFELPIVVVVLVSMRIFETAYLKKNRKYVLLIVVTIAAVITPPDVVSQVLLSVPMMLLFELGIFLGSIIEKKHAKEIAEEESE